MVVDIQDVVGMVAGLLNAADWDTITDVVLTSASPNISSASAGFTQNDEGKLFSLPGAGGDNKPLIGYILSVTNPTNAVLSVNSSISETGRSMSYGGRPNDPRHPEWKIVKAVLQRDLQICHGILSHPNHPRRNHFTSITTTEAQTNSGVNVPNRSGSISLTEIKHTDLAWRVGKAMPPEFLNRLLTWINNKSGLFTSEGYYTIVNGKAYFVGTDIRFTSVNLAQTTACQAPQEYEGVIALLAAADLFLTEGDDVQASQLLAQLGAATLQELIGSEAGNG